MRLKPKALTLLEVVAALALLSTLLVTVLTAQNRLAHQTRRAELRLQAIDAAEQLLATWSATSPMVIPDATGQLPTEPILHWKVTLRTQQEPQLLSSGVQVACLRVSDQLDMDDTDSPPLVTVEFLTTSTIPQ